MAQRIKKPRQFPPDDNDLNLVGILKQMQRQLDYLEKKINRLIEQSEGGRGDFRKPYQKRGDYGGGRPYGEDRNRSRGFSDQSNFSGPRKNFGWQKNRKPGGFSRDNRRDSRPGQ